MEQHKDLLNEIQGLKEYANAFKEVIDTLEDTHPFRNTIETILSWEVSEDITNGKLQRLKAELERIKRELESNNYFLVNRLIVPSTPGNVFRVVENFNKFAKVLRKQAGKTIDLYGEKVTLSADQIEAIIKYRFSIGSPPITVKGLQIIESLLFNSSVEDLYGFRDLLGSDEKLKRKFDDLMVLIAQLTSQSTSYLTNDQKEDHIKSLESEFFALRFCKKTIINGTPQTAIRILKNKVFRKGEALIDSKHRSIDEKLIKRMRKNKNTIFVVTVDHMEVTNFNSDKYPDWKELLGRMVIITNNSFDKSSNTIGVFSNNPNVIKSLETNSVKDVGTPSSVQLNLRRILNQFDSKSLAEIVKQTDTLIEKNQAAMGEPDIGELSLKTWKRTLKKDLAALKKFKKTLLFIEQLRNSGDKEMKKLQAAKISEVEDLTFRYFFGDLKRKEQDEKEGHSIIAIPQGGGRKELGIIGQYLLKRHRERMEAFRAEKLNTLQSRLTQIKVSKGVGIGTTEEGEHARRRALSLMETPEDQISHSPSIPTIRDAIKNRINEAFLNGLLPRLESYFQEGFDQQDKDESSRMGKLQKLLSKIPGINKISPSQIEPLLKTIAEALTKAAKIKGITLNREAVYQLIKEKLGDFDSASKQLERGRFKQGANLANTVIGSIHRVQKEVMNLGRAKLQKISYENQNISTHTAEKLINLLSSGQIKPSLVLSAIGWTFSDVFDTEDFPEQNYISIQISPDGQLNPQRLEADFQKLKKELYHFPELFEFVCQSCVMVINNPHNPTGKVLTDDTLTKLLEIASEYGLPVVSDEAYRKQVISSSDAPRSDSSLLEFYSRNESNFRNHVEIFTSLPTTKWSSGGGKRTGVIVTNSEDSAFEPFAREVASDSCNLMALEMDIEELKAGITVKSITKILEKHILNPETLLKDPKDEIESILLEMSKKEEGNVCMPLMMSLIKARNNLDLLKLRTETPVEYRLECSKYLNSFIKEIKEFRLDKLTLKDNKQRIAEVKKAVNSVSQDYPWIKENLFEPEGPFYLTFQLDKKVNREELTQFLLALASKRGVDAVPQKNGHVRLSFGGLLSGTAEEYSDYGKAVEVKLRLLLKYWEIYKAQKQQEKNKTPSEIIQMIFPDTEEDLIKALEENAPLAQKQFSGQSGSKLPNLPNALKDVASKIESSHPSTVYRIENPNLSDFADFIKEFRVIMDAYIVKNYKTIPDLAHLSSDSIQKRYSSSKIIEKIHTRSFKDNEREIFSSLVSGFIKYWYSDNTIKILMDSGENTSRDSLLGLSVKTKRHFERLMAIFVPPDKQKELITELNQGKKEEYRSVESATSLPDSYHVGFKPIKGAKADDCQPGWAKTMIPKASFVTELTPTAKSPEMVTPGAARVAGHDRAIFRRDVGENAPPSEFFSNRLQEFTETMNGDDYSMKLIQIGPVKVLLVLNKSYSHYLAEELRLFPQYDVKPEDLDKINPDSYSFLGIPQKVMGEHYKTGYFKDKKADGTEVPVSWIDAENITDYMGYLKKPVLTMANEVMEQKGLTPIHGSAFTVNFKNGMKKTVVMGGDSGTGKSETILALMEAVFKQNGGAENVESVDLLAGDMLSMFHSKDDKESGIYMLGTEQGDFTRLTDLSEGWKSRSLDLLYEASKTNMHHPNCRATISNLCDPEKFLIPSKVDYFFNINNYEAPPGGKCVVEEDTPETLYDSYVNGCRGEKGTSGDQPSIREGILKSNLSQKEKDALLRYEFELDELLGWGDLKLDKNGKVEKAYLQFKNIEGGIFRAKKIVEQMFKGKKLPEGEITEVKYDPNPNCERFYVMIKTPQGKTIKKPIDRDKVFGQLYPKIASTQFGQPFIHPGGMPENVKKIFSLFSASGVKAGTIYTQLKTEGMEMEGPKLAQEAFINTIEADTNINAQFHKEQAAVQKKLVRKYGENIFLSTVPQHIERHNIRKKAIDESSNVIPLNIHGQRVDLETPLYSSKQKKNKNIYKAVLLTPQVHEDLKFALMMLESEDRINITHINTSNQFSQQNRNKIKTWDNKEELIYQILAIMNPDNLKKESLAGINMAELAFAKTVADEMDGEKNTKQSKTA